MKQIQTKKGFSFLEVIVVVSIILIMTSLVFIVSFKERNRKKVQAVSRETIAAIRESQNYSLTGKYRRNEGLPCAFGVFFIADDGNVVGVNGSTGLVERASRIQLRGSYHKVNASCGADTDPTAYGVIFSDTDLGEQNVEIYSFTGNQTSVSAGNHPSPYIVFTVPYGRYLDRETEDSLEAAGNTTLDPSMGTELIVRPIGDTENEYHICIYDTGMVDDRGFVKRTGGAANFPLVCGF